MNALLPEYQVSEATWFYLSFLLIVAVFFKFSRLWSLRNLDLALLLAISPGLLFIRTHPTLGYSWLFASSAALLVRTLFDGAIVRRPRLESNMNAAGMTFLCAAAFAFLMTKVMIDPPDQQAIQTVNRADQLLQRRDDKPSQSIPKSAIEPGPASQMLVAGVTALSKAATPHESQGSDFQIIAARTLAILAHLAVILGLVYVGKSLFNDLETGLAMATLYMLLPCTAFDVAKANHVLPAALIIWAIGAYRQPIVAGILLGLASGTMFFPVFLLPLWIVFYGRRGGLQFVAAVACVAAIILGSLVLVSADSHSFLQKTFGYLDLAKLQFRMVDLSSDVTQGFWHEHQTVYRIPVFVAFLVMMIALAIWPTKKSMSQVISYSAAIVLGIQFWFPQQGGVYVLWYLPLLLLVAFRPMMTNHYAPEVTPLVWSSKARAAKGAATSSVVTSAMVGRTAYR